MEKYNPKDNINKSIKNVILLSMSTLPVNIPEPNVYEYKNEKGKKSFFHGISQLESETKLILSMLADKKQKVDSIVCLCSDEALKTAAQSYNKEGLSALSFFVNRMLAYIKPNYYENKKYDAPGIYDPFGSFETLKNSAAIRQQKKEKITKLEENKETPLSIHYERIDHSFFNIIEMKKEDFFWNAVNAIAPATDDAQVHLYMNMQGGDRTAIAEMNAITELLKSRNVIIKGRYVNDYNPGKTLHHSMEVSSRYSKYELVSALQMFRNFGWGTDLQKYFNDYIPEKDDPLANEYIKKLLNAIDKASNGIRLCDMNEFDEALNDIAGLTLPEEVKDSIIRLVFDEIKNEYGDLLIKHGPLEKIKWALENEFLQQALTILESQMPSLINTFVRSEILKVEERDLNNVSIFNEVDKSEYSIEKLVHYRKVNDSVHGWEDDSNYFYSCWCGNPLTITKADQALYLNLADNLLKKWEEDKDQLVRDIKIEFSEDKYCWDKFSKKQYKKKATVCYSFKEEVDHQLLGFFICLHNALKMQRNATNHSVREDRLNIQKVKDSLFLYLKVARELGM